MTATVLPANDGSHFAALNGIPRIDFPRNLKAALAAGRRMTSILSEMVALRRAAGKLTPNEYFYYRLWQPDLTREERRCFVGKQAQHPMHIACNHAGWYAAAADKLLFHTLMAGAGMQRPELLAITQPGRRPPGGRVLHGEEIIAAFLRDPAHYPLFAKPINGKYSLSVISANGYDAAADRVLTARRRASLAGSPREGTGGQGGGVCAPAAADTASVPGAAVRATALVGAVAGADDICGAAGSSRSRQGRHRPKPGRQFLAPRQHAGRNRPLDRAGGARRPRHRGRGGH